MAVAHGSFRDLLKDNPLEPAVRRAVESHPCGPDLHRAFGCPLFHPGVHLSEYWTPTPPQLSSGPAVRNFENNQPPLDYAVAGASLAAISTIWPRWAAAPERSLLILRFLSVLFVAAALFGPLRRLAAGRSSTFVSFGLGAMFLPGFTEAFVRCSNDALLFLWVSGVVAMMAREYRGPALLPILASGCLIKLNALPVLVFAIAVLWSERRRALALSSSVTAALPIAVLHGWRWGGGAVIGKDLAPRGIPAWEYPIGIGRSVYAIVKTMPWLGGWSVFRAPGWLLALGAVLVALLASRLRRAKRPRRRAAHTLALAVALAATLAFLLASWRVFGTWGGAGGWHFWSWTPWIALLLDDIGRWRGPSRSATLAAAGYLLLINVVWFARAFAMYY